MLKFLLFLGRIHFVILFLVLEAAAISFFVGGNAYQRARIINVSNVVTASIYQHVSGVSRYFGLVGQNEILMSEVASLREELSRVQFLVEQSETLNSFADHGSSGEPDGFQGYNAGCFVDGIRGDSLGMVGGSGDDSVRYQPRSRRLLFGQTTRYTVARVINNSITKRDNYIVIDKGRKDGMEPDMALVSDLGIVGYLLACSQNYSVALSVLNASDFKTSGRIKGSDFTGTISWPGLSHRTVDLTQVPKYAGIKPGDTIVTTDYSNIFPADFPIGRVSDCQMSDGAFYNARVELFADMSTLKYVYAVKLPRQRERDSLESMYVK